MTDPTFLAPPASAAGTPPAADVLADKVGDLRDIAARVEDHPTFQGNGGGQLLAEAVRHVADGLAAIHSLFTGAPRPAE